MNQRKEEFRKATKISKSSGKHRHLSKNTITPMRAKEGMPDKRTGLLPSFLVSAMQKNRNHG